MSKIYWSNHKIKQPTEMPYYTGVTIKYMLNLATLHMFILIIESTSTTLNKYSWIDSLVLKSSRCKLLWLKLPAFPHNLLRNTSAILSSSTSTSTLEVLIIFLHVYEDHVLQTSLVSLDIKWSYNSFTAMRVSSVVSLSQQHPPSLRKPSAVWQAPLQISRRLMTCFNLS